MQQVRAIEDYRTHSYLIFDQWDQPHRVPVALSKEEVDVQETPTIPDIMLNPNKSRNQIDLTDTEYDELSMGRNQMEALLNQIIREAEEEMDEWDGEGERLEAEGMEASDSEEDYVKPVNSLYTVPSMSGKGQRY